MAFPVDEKYISEAESEFNIIFPNKFRERMAKFNGGTVEYNDFLFKIHPVLDKSDKKRISRTCNHIGLETKNALQWNGFPENGIAVGDGGSGDVIFLLHNGDGLLSEDVFLWDHGDVKKIADSIEEFENC